MTKEKRKPLFTILIIVVTMALLIIAYKIFFFRIGDETYFIYQKEICVDDTDLSEMKLARNPETVVISYCKIDDISVLSELPTIKTIFFYNSYGNENTDWTPLGSLRNLENCWLWNNGFKDIEVLENLTELRDLELGYNPVSDISCLNKLNRLERLSLVGTDITDIAVVKNMPELNNLGIAKTNITDVSVLFELKNLKELYVSPNQIDNETLDRLKENGVTIEFID